MALYFKNWNSLKTCGLSFLSPYPVLIAGGYCLIHDWILSARLISLFFGTALLVPLYLMLKEWVREDSAILGLLVFAVTPVLVSNSVELVRDPICWFFLCAGVFAVIRQATRAFPMAASGCIPLLSGSDLGQDRSRTVSGGYPGIPSAAFNNTAE